MYHSAVCYATLKQRISLKILAFPLPTTSVRDPCNFNISNIKKMKSVAFNDPLHFFRAAILAGKSMFSQKLSVFFIKKQKITHMPSLL